MKLEYVEPGLERMWIDHSYRKLPLVKKRFVKHHACYTLTECVDNKEPLSVLELLKNREKPAWELAVEAFCNKK